MQLLVRDVRGGRPLELWRGNSLWDLKWLSDGSHLVISGRHAGSFETWLVPRLAGAARRLDTGGGFVTISPDGSHVAIASQGSQGFTIVPKEERKATANDGSARFCGIRAHAYSASSPRSSVNGGAPKTHGPIGPFEQRLQMLWTSRRAMRLSSRPVVKARTSCGWQKLRSTTPGLMR
jgi:hypothetical protein